MKVATYAIDAERVEFAVFALLESIARLALRLPPFVVQDLDDALLLQFQDGQRDAVPPWRADGRGDTEIFGIDQTAHLKSMKFHFFQFARLLNFNKIL